MVNLIWSSVWVSLQCVLEGFESANLWVLSGLSLLSMLMWEKEILENEFRSCVDSIKGNLLPVQWFGSLNSISWQMFGFIEDSLCINIFTG